MADKPSLLTIEPKGDVILELSSTKGKIQLLVSSKILTLMSPVFERLFSSQLKEGLRNNLTVKPVIPLPEDDAEAFIVLCKTTHFYKDKEPNSPSSACLERLAITCDKYDCVRAISHSSAAWLQAAAENCTWTDYNKLLLAAYVLDVPDAFSRISWKILLRHTGSFTSLPGVADHELGPSNLLGKTQSV